MWPHDGGQEVELAIRRRAHGITVQLKRDPTWTGGKKLIREVVVLAECINTERVTSTWVCLEW